MRFITFGIGCLMGFSFVGAKERRTYYQYPAPPQIASTIITTITIIIVEEELEELEVVEEVLFRGIRIERRISFKWREGTSGTAHEDASAAVPVETGEEAAAAEVEEAGRSAGADVLPAVPEVEPEPSEGELAVEFAAGAEATSLELAVALVALGVELALARPEVEPEVGTPVNPASVVSASVPVADGAALRMRVRRRPTIRAKGRRTLRTSSLLHFHHH